MQRLIAFTIGRTCIGFPDWLRSESAPRCHALVERRSAFHRVTGALLIGGVSLSSVGF
jgi:hypothetical protein